MIDIDSNNSERSEVQLMHKRFAEFFGNYCSNRLVGKPHKGVELDSVIRVRLQLDRTCYRIRCVLDFRDFPVTDGSGSQADPCQYIQNFQLPSRQALLVRFNKPGLFRPRAGKTSPRHLRQRAFAAVR